MLLHSSVCTGLLPAFCWFLPSAIATASPSASNPKGARQGKGAFFISSSRFVLSSERNGGLYYSIWNYRLSSPPAPAKYGVCVASLSLFVNWGLSTANTHLASCRLGSVLPTCKHAVWSFPTGASHRPPHAITGKLPPEAFSFASSWKDFLALFSFGGTCFGVTAWASHQRTFWFCCLPEARLPPDGKPAGKGAFSV